MKDYQKYIDEADAFANKGDKENAIKSLNEAIKYSPNQVTAYYNLAMLYYSLNDLYKAIEYFEKAGILNPLDSSIFHNLGVIYYANKEFAKSELNFKKAININPDHIEAIYGLGKIYKKLAEDGKTEMLNEYKNKIISLIETLYEDNNLESALMLSEKSIKIFPDNPEILNNHAVLCYKLGRIEEAKKSISVSKDLFPENSDINDNYEMIFNKKEKQEEKPIFTEPKQKKLAVFCGPDDKFINDIIKRLDTKYEIKRFQNGTIQDMQDMMRWSDISWFEWCDGLVLHATKLPKTCKTICRLHSYEAFTDIIKQVNWKLVDDLIFVAPHIKDIVIKQMPKIKDDVNIHVIPNGVELDRFKFKDRQKGFNIAYVGYINHKKNPSLLLQCIKYLVDIDSRYILHIAGQHQELRFKLYFDHIIKEMKLDKNVIFHGWIDDVSSWLDDKHFTISTSVLESFCYGIADAMSCGLKPLIHNFIGAKDLYPQKYIFNDIKDFSEMVLNDDYNPMEYRKFIEDNYSQTEQIKKIEILLRNLS